VLSFIRERGETDLQKRALSFEMRVATFLIFLTAVNAVFFKQRYCPLIGGPKWLKLHRVVELYSSSSTTTTTAGRESTINSALASAVPVLVVDFVPKDAQAPLTLFSLVLGRSVPGDIRIRVGVGSSIARSTQQQQPVVDDTAALLAAVQCYVDSSDSILNLYTRNCYTFTDGLVKHLGARPL
jgi:hypothetical protein